MFTKILIENVKCIQNNFFVCSEKLIAMSINYFECKQMRIQYIYIY